MIDFDLIIIGGGPAGLTAAIYASRYNLKTAIISEKLGGEITNAPFIENYPGFKKIPGVELVQKIEEQVRILKVKIIIAKVEDIKKINGNFQISTGQQKFLAKTILLAIGMERRKLNVPGEKEFLGRGVAYCSTCDGPLFRGKIVAVAGGGDAGLASANYLAQFCKQVYILEMMLKLMAEPYWQDKIKNLKNVKIFVGTKIQKIVGKETVEKIIFKTEKGEKELAIDGIFIEIGSAPNRKFCDQLKIDTDEKGFIKINQSGATNQKGIWAAGDITTGSDYFWQALPAMAEGAIAAHSIYQYLK